MISNSYRSNLRIPGCSVDGSELVCSPSRLSGAVEEGSGEETRPFLDSRNAFALLLGDISHIDCKYKIYGLPIAKT